MVCLYYLFNFSPLGGLSFLHIKRDGVMVVTAAGLFQDIADAVTHDAPDMTPTWLVGYFLGGIDALLRDRKTPPRGR
jgi:hypothetical protein